MVEKFFLRKKKNKNDKNLNFENTKPPEIFHFPIFFWVVGKKKLQKLQFSFYQSFMNFYPFLTLIPSKFQKLDLFFEFIKKFEKLWFK